MRNGKMTYIKIDETEVNHFGMILPLILFGMGILVPVFTDELLIIVLSFLPFYGYMLWNEKSFDGSSIFVSRVVFATSFILGFFISVLNYHEMLMFLDTAGTVLLVNVIPSFCFLIFVIVKVGAKSSSLYDYSPPSD